MEIGRWFEEIAQEPIVPVSEDERIWLDADVNEMYFSPDGIHSDERPKGLISKLEQWQTSLGL